MSAWRSRRQFIAVFIIVAPIVAVVFLFVRQAFITQSCFDNRRNQNETGVDCGGMCISCNLKYPQPIKVFWARAVPVRENFYDMAAEIENPNETISSVDVEYEFRLFDQYGPIISRIGKTFLYAHERTLVIVPGIETTREASNAEFRIINVVWQGKSDFAPTIIAEKRDYHTEGNPGQEQGIIDITLFNQSPYDFSSVDAQIAVLDHAGNLLGANKIRVDNFRSQSRRAIKAIWPRAFSSDIAVINVQPRVNIFEPNTILKPQ